MNSAKDLVPGVQVRPESWQVRPSPIKVGGFRAPPGGTDTVLLPLAHLSEQWPLKWGWKKLRLFY